MPLDDAEFALLITWTCYGTWLPGDRRGYVSNTLLPDGSFAPKQNVPGAAITRDDPRTRLNARNLQKHASACLTEREARIVAEAMTFACLEGGWQVVRAAVMWNHVHVVITCCPDDGPAVRRILKGVSQSHLNKAIGHPRRWWTSGGSNRYLHGHRAVQGAINYVENQHGKLVEIINNQVYVVERSKSSKPSEKPSERRGLSPP